MTTTPTPTTPGRTFTEYADGDRDLFLGELVWFSVGEAASIRHDVLLAELTTLKLESFCPRIPRDDDVFRRTCSQHQRKRVPTALDGVFENYLIRDVKRGAGQVVKHIVVEQVDGANKRLDYTPAISLTFDSKTGKIEVDVLSATPDAQVMNVAQLILQDFEREKGMVNSYGVRDLFRSILSMTGATSVRPGGGVYFVMQAKVEFVDALETLATKVSYVEVTSVPLVDDRKQREMVRKAVEAETTGEIDKMLAEIDEVMSGPEITSDRFMAMSTRMRDMRSRTQEYAELLDEELGNTDFRLKVLETKMRQLYDHTK
jgi:hypothetical protein